jgi:hypothetical protein
MIGLLQLAQGQLFDLADALPAQIERHPDLDERPRMIIF